MPLQLTSPSGVASPQDAPCDVPGYVRLGRPWGPRLAMLVSWLGTMPHQTRVKCLAKHWQAESLESPRWWIRGMLKAGIAVSVNGDG